MSVFEKPGYTNKAVLDRYLALPQGERICATYVWIDGSGEGMRSKVKCLDSKPTKVDDLPMWNYDGSSCYQVIDYYHCIQFSVIMNVSAKASGENSDVYLKPVKMYPCPFTKGDNILVMCDTYNFNDEPMKTNKRKACLEVMEKAKDQKPWFGIEQEYTLFDYDKQPFGWPKSGYPGPQGPYYCAVGARNVYGRDIETAHVM